MSRTPWLALIGMVTFATVLSTTGADAAAPEDQPVHWDARTVGADARPQRILDQAVRITNDFAGRPANQCLDVDANGGGDGTKVQIWECNGSTQQRWYVWNDGRIESYRFPGKCLDADTNGGGANGTKVQVWQCNGSTQQRWSHPTGDRALYNLRFYNNGNTVLDRDANVRGNGARVQLWQKNFQSQQWWDVRTD